MALCFLPVAWLAQSVAIWTLLFLSLLSAVIGVSLQLVLAGWQMATRTEAERARFNGWAVAGVVVGGVVGASLMPIIALRIGWMVAVPLLGLRILLCGLAAPWLRGEAKAAQEATSLTSFLEVRQAPSGGKLLMINLLLAFAPPTKGLFAVTDFMLAGALTVAAWQCDMAASRNVVPVTHYGVVTSLDALTRFFAGLLAGSAATAMGYTGMFGSYAALSLAATSLLAFLSLVPHSPTTSDEDRCCNRARGSGLITKT